MAMMVNASAQFSLNEVNSHTNEAGKALAKISSGMKINSAGDNSADYAISERMRVQIRALNQNTQNVQNGSALLKTAERGVSQIVENLRSMKELAVDSANDSNTDEDRKTLQKEFEQRMDTINELVYATRYNGKILLDGRYDRPALGAIPVKNLVDAFKASYAAVEDLDRHFSKSSNATEADPANWIFQVDKSFNKTDDSASNFSVEVDFSAMDTEGSPLLDSLHGQGFSILCGGCQQYINILFNANKTVDESTYNANASSTNTMAREFIIGVKDVTSAEDLAQAVFEGISAVRNQITQVAGFTSTADDFLLDATHKLRIRLDPNDSSKVLFTKDSLAMQFRNGIIPNPDMDELEALEKKKTTGPLWVHHGVQNDQHTNFYVADLRTSALGTGQLFNGGSLINESDIARYDALNDNSTKQSEWVATLKKAENKVVDDISVKTKEDANIAIRVLDGALDYTLNEATHLGAYLQRLEHTDANVLTMSENAQNTESIIRDADMAKEMTNYTKYHMLAQSAQAMLAQAVKQNNGAVLGLLQEGED